ncbi:glycosyltransferase family 2 protein [Paraclostridium sordellii]|uniref:tetratricopeptide repeat-containing glycosyltransferase family 2 protein n=1 Tax=Paraclostridium sordellii TaxID=1505 RepID=UPI0022DEC125|nr:glycosyltransferase family 2 protein [Paeniclostridium sordellii]
MENLNLVMIVKNEESKLRRCLNSTKDLVSKIIIVDTGSTDGTKDIALEFGAIVYDYTWDNNFSNARNFGLMKSDSDWNLILDADEFISTIEYDKIFKILNSKEKFIGKIKIVSLFEQNNEIRKSASFISRLIPKGVCFTGSIHEQIDSNLPRNIVNIEVEHDGYLNTNKFNRNIDLILKELGQSPQDLYLLYQAAKTYYSNKMFNEASAYFDKFYNSISSYKDEFIKDGLILYLYNLIKTNNIEKGLIIIENIFDYMNDCCDFHFVCGLIFTELVAFDSNKYISYFDNINICYLNALQLDYEIVEGTGSYLAAFNLGTFYELTGNLDAAIKYFNISASYNYQLALNKLNTYRNKIEDL